MAEGADATLAPNVGPVERDDRRDTGFFSGGVLSTPADFRQSRRPSTRECSPAFRDLEGTSDDFAAGTGPPTSLIGSPPIHGGLGTWPVTPGIAPRRQSDMEDGDFRHVSFRRGTKGPTEEDQRDCLLETMAEEIDSLRKILSEVQTGSRTGHAGEGELGRPCRTGTDRIRPERPEPPSGSAPGPSQPGQLSATGSGPEPPPPERSGHVVPPPSRPENDDTLSARHRQTLPTLKLGTYDVSTPLGTFLAKFDNCSDYYSWDARERLNHLRASLEKDAGQVLWDAGKQSSVDDLIALLRNRFGSANQCERYRAELRALRRRKGIRCKRSIRRCVA